ncbi:hypothetical protein J6590_027295 [Homalodisca vitripennis]|nr:hypothetical protein J6590_027295 [Homalodisca vitripennis]
MNKKVFYDVANPSLGLGRPVNVVETYLSVSLLSLSVRRPTMCIQVGSSLWPDHSYTTFYTKNTKPQKRSRRELNTYQDATRVEHLPLALLTFDIC